LSCCFRDAIWSSESCVATIVTRCLLLKYSQSGWRSNKSSKSNASYLARSLHATAQLHEITQLFCFTWECCLLLQQSIARWLHLKNIQLRKGKSYQLH
jgi:hypothetical protein